MEHIQAGEVLSQVDIGVHHNRANRRGTVPSASLKKVKLLLLYAAVSLLSDYYDMVRKYYTLSHEKIGIEFSFCGGDSIAERQNNEDR